MMNRAQIRQQITFFIFIVSFTSAILFICPNSFSSVRQACAEIDLSDAPKAVTAPRQIRAAWSASRYRHGGQMTGIEHIMYRHSAQSGFANVSRFAQGTKARDIAGYVDSALRYGNVTQTGQTAFTIEHNLGRTIGTNIAGDAASSIRVFVRDGIIQTTFPF